MFLLCLIVSIGCRRNLDDNESFPSSGQSTISGKITQSISLSLRANGLPAGNAKVWLEQRPDLYAMTDPDGRFLIAGIPPGVYKIVAKYSQGTTIFKVRSPSISVSTNENKNSDLATTEARLDVIEAKIDEVIAALKAANIMA